MNPFAIWILCAIATLGVAACFLLRIDARFNAALIVACDAGDLLGIDAAKQIAVRDSRRVLTVTFSVLAGSVAPLIAWSL